MVHGDKEAVDAILQHPDITAVSFVGSTADRQIYLQDRRGGRQAGAGAGRSEEPHGGDAGRRTRSADALMGAAYGSRASAAWPSRQRSPSAASATN